MILHGPCIIQLIIHTHQLILKVNRTATLLNGLSIAWARNDRSSGAFDDGRLHGETGLVKKVPTVRLGDGGTQKGGVVANVLGVNLIYGAVIFIS